MDKLKIDTKHKPEWIEKVIHHMIHHFSEHLTLDDLANAVGMSKYNMCRQFSRYQGMPPLKWLWRFRALLASELLKLPLKWDIQEVAYACGFTSCAHFSRIFRESFGSTPSRYRVKMSPAVAVSHSESESSVKSMDREFNFRSLAQGVARVACDNPI